MSRPAKTRHNKQYASKDRLAGRLDEIAGIGGYQKPEMIHGDGGVKLDSNENYVIPRQFQAETVSNACASIDARAYPLGGTERLIQAIAGAIGMPASMIGVGNGSDQILDLILGHFATKQTKILTSDPTFGFFEDRCRLYSVPLIRVPFSDDMRLDVSELLEKSSSADIIYLDSPNNPTGFQLAKPDMQRLIRSFEGKLIIIDEAYGDFGDYTIAKMTRRYKNLVVVRTLSKSFGLAGLRLGYLIANKRFAELFMSVIQYPYPLSTVTIDAGIAAMGRISQMRKTVETIKDERARIINTLRGHDAFEVFDSRANFVLFDARGAYKRVHAALAEQGIAIRSLGRIGNRHGCLRVTVGTREMNSRFLLAVRDLFG